VKRKVLIVGIMAAATMGLVSPFATTVRADTQHTNEVIVSDETWYPSGNTHIVTGYVLVNSGVTLTIESGCIVHFEYGAYIEIYGVLEAHGELGAEVIFTRHEADDAWWGLWFYSGSAGALEYCTIEHATMAGGAINAEGMFPDIRHCTIQNNAYGIYASNVTSPALSVSNTIEDNNSGVVFSNCTDVSISNQTITGHTGYWGAIGLSNCGEFHIGPGNSATGNSWGLSIDVASWPSEASAGNIPVAGNINEDGIRVYGGGLSETVTWHDVDADYIALGDIQVATGGALFVEPGCTVCFEQAGYIDVYGVLEAHGEPGAEVVFTRRDVDDEWYGLWFYSGSAGVLESCTIEHATAWGAISIEESSLELRYCTLRDNHTGISADDASPTILNSTITGNLQYGVHLTGSCLPHFGNSISEWNDIYDNGPGEPGRNLRNGVLDINASYVYWGSVLEMNIEYGIYHASDDTTLGTVFYCPWTDALHDSLYGDCITGVDPQEPDHGVPTEYTLFQNSPNPFELKTQIRYALPRHCHVLLEIYDIRGRKVETLIDGHEEPGFKSVCWDGTSLSSGVYFCRLRTRDFSDTKRMVLIR